MNDIIAYELTWINEEIASKFRGVRDIESLHPKIFINSAL